LCDISLIPLVFKWENGGIVKEMLHVESLPLLFFELILFLCPDSQLWFNVSLLLLPLNRTLERLSMWSWLVSHVLQLQVLINYHLWMQIHRKKLIWKDVIEFRPWFLDFSIIYITKEQATHSYLWTILLSSTVYAWNENIH
jgi:hypothetical protein